MKTLIFLTTLLVVPTAAVAQTTKLTITSPAFKTGGMIPKQFTCDGKNISPPLAWNGVPEKIKSFAIIVDDPDAPKKTWVHWVLFNIPSYVRAMAEDMPQHGQLKKGAFQGTTDFKKIGYGGPCPPSGTHRYYFKVYALDTLLTLKPGITKAQLLKAMKGHIIAKGELMGKYTTSP